MLRFENKFPINLKNLKDTLSLSAKIGSREIKRGLKEAKRQISKIQLIQRRKELFAELGCSLYEAHEDGLTEELQHFLKNTELNEIIMDIKNIDNELQNIQK